MAALPGWTFQMKIFKKSSIEEGLARGKGTSPRKERDSVEILSGIFEGRGHRNAHFPSDQE